VRLARATGLPPALRRKDHFMNARAIRIIGIDPGLRNVGWGLIEVEGSRLVYVACGSLKTDPALSLAPRRPDEAAVEETFVNRDPQSALKLGQARGIALAAPALLGLPVAEYAANVIKKTIVGVGHAEKAQIAMMVKMLLPACQIGSPDAADALAVAITHAQHRLARARGAA